MTDLMRILVSDLGRAAVQEDLGRVMGPRPYAFVSPEQTAATGGGCDIAFVSRDVTGRSTKHEVLPSTQQFYDTLLACRDLRWVHVHSAGVDRPVYQQLQQRGVRVTGSVGANAAIVAQTALAGLLAFARRLPLLMQSQRSRQWTPLHGELMPRDLQGQHITIVGWGAIGQHLASYARMLGLQITVVRNSEAPVGGDIQTLTYSQLHQALPRTQWLVLACPSTDQTRGLMDAQALAALPSGAHLINVARGDIVDEQALIGALQNKELAGAFLDVFAHEPLAPDSALWSMPQVIATPHCAGFSDGNESRVAQLFIANLTRFLAGTL
jgi:phosphoglycerate dehydrogenase-like enzyme